MNLNQLYYLRALVYHGSFSAAAKKLDISQPALSMQIQKLEEELGLPLIIRTKKPLQLTRDGEIIYEKVIEIIQKIEALQELPNQLSLEIVGELRLGMIPTIAPYFISLFMEALNRTHPELKLVVEELITEQVIEQVRTGRLDAGIIATPVNVKNLKMEPLMYERFFLYVSPDHPLCGKERISLEEVNEEEIWYLKEGNCFTNQVDAICNLAGKTIRSDKLSYYSNSIESLRRIVKSKGGVTFIPELATINIPSEEEEMITGIEGSNKPIREISIVTTSQAAKAKLLGAFRKSIVEQLPASMKEKPKGWIVHTEIHM
jgi:LysR family hydrogen peroxide-inducible transcriptional activator